MSGMKFRIQCAGCGATFFSVDRKSRLCPKCVKKRGVKSPSIETKRDGETKREGARPQSARPETKPDPPFKKPQKPSPAPVKPPKTANLTPELRDRVTQLFQARQPHGEMKLDEIVAVISDEAWV